CHHAWDSRTSLDLQLQWILQKRSGLTTSTYRREIDGTYGSINRLHQIQQWHRPLQNVWEQSYGALIGWTFQMSMAAILQSQYSYPLAGISVHYPSSTSIRPLISADGI